MPLLPMRPDDGKPVAGIGPRRPSCGADPPHGTLDAAVIGMPTGSEVGCRP